MYRLKKALFTNTLSTSSTPSIPSFIHDICFCAIPPTYFPTPLLSTRQGARLLIFPYYPLLYSLLHSACLVHFFPSFFVLSFLAATMDFQHKSTFPDAFLFSLLCVLWYSFILTSARVGKSMTAALHVIFYVMRWLFHPDSFFLFRSLHGTCSVSFCE